MLNSLPISGPVVEARPDKFNFGRLCGGGGDGSSGYIGLEASKLVLRQCAESRSDMSLLGGNIYNLLNSDISSVISNQS